MNLHDFFWKQSTWNVNLHISYEFDQFDKKGST